MKLGDIAEMRTGIIVSNFNGNITEDNQLEYKILNLSSIDVYNKINLQNMEKFKGNYEKIKDCLTKKGDILIRQSHPFTVLIIDNEIDLIVPSTFLIIRIKLDSYDKGFVGWYLGTYKVRNNFIRTQTGSIQPTINKKIISDIVLPNLNIADQHKISQLINIMAKRSQKANKLLNEYEKENEVITKLLIQNMERN